MSMLSMTGQLIHIFESPKGEKDGKEYGGQDKLQVLGQVALPNGESKNELITLTTHNKSHFSDCVGQNIRVPIGIFAQAKSVTYFIPKGSKPEIINSL